MLLTPLIRIFAEGFGKNWFS